MKNNYFTTNISFNDSDMKNNELKNVISVRDGVQEYLGVELGLEPKDKVFKIYRSPDTIKKINDLLNDVPVTDEHIDIKSTIPKDKVLGKIKESEIVENEDTAIDSTVALKNVILLDKNKLKLIKSKELSLGYSANMVESDKYDFEQENIKPHHLAIVPSGRCGETCKFLDQKEVKVMTLDEVVKVIGGMSNEDKGKIFNSLSKEFKKPDENSTNKDSDKKIKDIEEKHKEEIEKVKNEAIENYKDSCGCKKEMLDYANTRVSIIDKARNYLGDDYSFIEKTNHQIMQDSVTAELPKENFADNEISVAFKMLKEKTQTVDNTHFTDSNDVWGQAYEMEIK